MRRRTFFMKKGGEVLKKRILGLLLSVTMVAGLLAGCGTPAAADVPVDEVSQDVESTDSGEAPQADLAAHTRLITS